MMSKIKYAFSWLVNNVFWRFVFWWKKRTGWLDLNQIVECSGTITLVDNNVAGIFNDGDICFNVKLDPQYEWLITGFGGRLTAQDGIMPPTIHCEIPPWTRDKFMDVIPNLAIGKRVYVKGAWGFDGVHLGKPEWLEVIYAIFRHQSNVRQGWFEIHPCTEIKLFD